MKACVLTVDQRSSRTTSDLVPAAVDEYAADVLLPFERTAGDEIQAVYTDPGAAAAVIESLLRSDARNIGLGIGHAEEPLPATARTARRNECRHARAGVHRATNSPGKIHVVGPA